MASRHFPCCSRHGQKWPCFFAPLGHKKKAVSLLNGLTASSNSQNATCHKYATSSKSSTSALGQLVECVWSGREDLNAPEAHKPPQRLALPASGGLRLRLPKSVPRHFNYWNIYRILHTNTPLEHCSAPEDCKLLSRLFLEQGEIHLYSTRDWSEGF